MPFTILDGGSFLSTGAGVKVPLPSSADYFKTVNITQMVINSPAAATGCVAGEWFGPKFGAGKSPINDGLRWRKEATHAIFIDAFSTSVASDGFTYITSSPVTEAQNAVAITSITAASPAVVSQAAHGYKVGDILRIYGTTGMLQIAGMDFQISTVNTNDYTLIGLQAVAFAGAATAGFTRRISKFNAVEPEFLYVTGVSKATQAIVRTSVDPTNYYAVGMKVHFRVPRAMGMFELDQMTGTILSMSAANYTMTVDIDTQAFTTFIFPASAFAAVGYLFATVAPAGASTQYDPIAMTYTGYNFDKQPFRTAQFVPYIFLAGGDASPAGNSGDQINWMSYKLES